MSGLGNNFNHIPVFDNVKPFLTVQYSKGCLLYYRCINEIIIKNVNEHNRTETEQSSYSNLWTGIMLPLAQLSYI